MTTTFFTNNSGNPAIRISGTGRYSAALFQELRKTEEIFLQQPKVFPVLLTLGKIIGKDVATFFQAFPLRFPTSPKTKILHCTSQTLALPLLFSKDKEVKYVLTVHDLIPIATNSYASVSEKIAYFFLKKALKRADHIIADSEHTKKDCVKYLNYPQEKITVIPLGIDETVFFEKKRVRKNTILYVGSEHKRKNVVLILRALPYIAEKIPDIRFVKVGQPQDAAMRQQLLLLAISLGIQQRIQWKDYVEDLAEEYSTASVFVFPSLYEGFGFPVLEAMACGCPVICSNKTSLPEIAGDAAVYCSEEDSEELAEKIVTVLKSKKMQEELRKKGKIQAKQFTWKKCAEETKKVYAQILKESKGV